MMISVSHITQGLLLDDGWMMNLREFGRRWSWPDGGTVLAFAYMDQEKSHKILRISSKDLKWIPPEYRSLVLPPYPLLSVFYSCSECYRWGAQLWHLNHPPSLYFLNSISVVTEQQASQNIAAECYLVGRFHIELSTLGLRLFGFVFVFFIPLANARIVPHFRQHCFVLHLFWFMIACCHTILCYKYIV